MGIITQNGKKILLLKYISDSEHGWIEIPKFLVEQLGFKDQITEYSYYSETTKNYYLEEDADATLLIKALKVRNINYELVSINHDCVSPIRRLPKVKK